MIAELEAMESNHTQSVVNLPQGKHSIGYKWVYKIKYNSDGSIDRYMVRLVVKGYSQQERLDFIEIFSPVAKLVTVNTILAIAAINQWHFTQLDVNNTFQNRDLFEEIYMDLSLGYSKQSASNS